MRWLVAVIGVLGCDQTKSPLPSAAECAAAAETFATTRLGDIADKNSIKRRNMITEVSQHCTNDRWSRDAAACVAKAVDGERQHSCRYKHFTLEQADKLSEVGDGASEVMAKMSEFNVKMCACTDASCARRVSDEMTEWSQQQARNTREPVRMSEADQRRATEIGTNMGECMVRAMGAGSANPDHVP